MVGRTLRLMLAIFFNDAFGPPSNWELNVR